MSVLAAFLQDQVEINKYVQLTAGLRVDRFEILPARDEHDLVAIKHGERRDLLG